MNKTLSRYLDELKKLNLPKGKYTIFGNGPLSIRGFHQPKDLDIIVTSDIFKKLLKKYPQDISKHPCNCLVIGNIEAGNTWQGSFNEVKKNDSHC